MFVSKFIKLLNGFSFSFILFVPFTLNENPPTVNVNSFIYFSGKGKLIPCGLYSEIFWFGALYSYYFFLIALNLENCGAMFVFSPINIKSLRKFVYLLSWKNLETNSLWILSLYILILIFKSFKMIVNSLKKILQM